MGASSSRGVCGGVSYSDTVLLEHDSLPKEGDLSECSPPDISEYTGVAGIGLRGVPMPRPEIASETAEAIFNVVGPAYRFSL